MFKLATVIMSCLLCCLPWYALADTPESAKPNEASLADAQTLPDTSRLFASITEQGILPLYRALDKKVQRLVTQSEAFCAQTDMAHLQALRSAWQDTLLAWQRTDALMFGPAIANQVDFHINFQPPKKLIINSLLRNDKAITPDSVHQGGVGGKGLSTLEYLLFNREQSDAKQLQAFTAGKAGERRCAYVQAVSQLLQQDINTITAHWQRDFNNYADALRTAGAGSPVFVSAREALDLIIRKLYQSVEKTSRNRLAKALGVGTSDKIIRPHALPAWRSGLSLAIVRANWEGQQQLLVEGGLLDWISEHDQRASTQQTLQSLRDALQGALALPVPEEDPFLQLEAGEVATVQTYYTQARRIDQLVQQQLAPLLGVQLGFNDNDGD